jgi:hypothetical protein
MCIFSEYLSQVIHEKRILKPRTKSIFVTNFAQLVVLFLSLSGRKH